MAPPDVRPTRFDLDALLGGTALTFKVRRAVVDALEDAGLLNGSKMDASTAAPDAYGRLPIVAVDRAIAGFDELTRTEVKSVLSSVNALAP
jgi:hypothetical protein